MLHDPVRFRSRRTNPASLCRRVVQVIFTWLGRPVYQRQSSGSFSTPIRMKGDLTGIYVESGTLYPAFLLVQSTNSTVTFSVTGPLPRSARA
jgi:hypothetical protein